MKKYFLLLLLLPLSLFGSKILSYNIYDRTERVDVMLTFDTPYNGLIKQSRSNTKIIIKLTDATIEAPKIKKIGSALLESITITPLQNATKLIAIAPSSVRLIASKTADGYGLRLRFTKKMPRKAESMQQQATANQGRTTTLPTKQPEDLSGSYMLVIAILIIGIAILLYIKKKTQQPLASTQKPLPQGGKKWLFQNNTPTQEQTPQSNEVTIRFQKAIDANNSVVMLDFGKESYLVLMGNGNILLDKFHDNQPTSQQEFESLLQDRHEELENFLNAQEQPSQPQVAQESKEPLKTYTERAASLAYEEQQPFHQ